MSEEVSNYDKLTGKICEKLCKEYLGLTIGSPEYIKVASLIEKVTPKMIEMVKEKEIESQKLDVERKKVENESRKMDIENKKLEADKERQDKEDAIERMKIEADKERQAKEDAIERMKIDVEKEKIEIEKQKLEADQIHHEYEVKKDKKDFVLKLAAIGATAAEFLIYIFFMFVSEEWNQAHTMSSPFAQKVLNQLPQFFKKSATPM